MKRKPGEMELSINADPAGPQPRELKKGSVWDDIQKMDPTKILSYHVSTTAELKCERVLPSGRKIRIFREGKATMFTCRETKTQDTHDFRLEARDALFLARDPNVIIEFQRERYEITEKDLADLAKKE